MENQYGKNPALEGGDINNVENRYEKKLNEDADGNQNYRYQEDNEDDSKELNRYKENPDNVVLEPHQIANAGPGELFSISLGHCYRSSWTNYQLSLQVVLCINF